MNTPLVSIGIPTFNRPEGLLRTLACVQAQTYSNLEVLVSDNASPNPAVSELLEDICKRDPRIRYVRQENNIGAARNFQYVFDHTSSPYFVWMSDDDLWEPVFIERGVAALQANNGAAGWFCTIDNINRQGRVCRQYQSFVRFDRNGSSHFRRVMAFLQEPEIQGKANLVYSIFRRPALGEALKICPFQEEIWGSDMCTVFALICRHDLLASAEVLLHKTVPTDANQIVVGRETWFHSPGRKSRGYVRTMTRAARGTSYWLPTFLVMHLRWLRLRWRIVSEPPSVRLLVRVLSRVCRMAP
jgi:cellulose synthase/poly-beta-1,6-N-acetylglucosamine synthase-like glycosyltransferase